MNSKTAKLFHRMNPPTVVVGNYEKQAKRAYNAMSSKQKAAARAEMKQKIEEKKKLDREALREIEANPGQNGPIPEAVLHHIVNFLQQQLDVVHRIEDERIMKALTDG